MQDGDFSRTALAVRALSAYPIPSRASEFRERVARGAAPELLTFVFAALGFAVAAERRAEHLGPAFAVAFSGLPTVAGG